MGARSGERGVTYLEMVATASIVAILASAILPMAKLTRVRQREIELRRALREVREAIDTHEKAGERGLIHTEQGNEHFPEDLETLVKGARLSGRPGVVMKKFLRRIPVDPFTGKNDDWGLRCYQDDPDSESWCGKNVYDIYTKHQGKALDGTRYRDW